MRLLSRNKRLIVFKDLSSKTEVYDSNGDPVGVQTKNFSAFKSTYAYVGNASGERVLDNSGRIVNMGITLIGVGTCPLSSNSRVWVYASTSSTNDYQVRSIYNGVNTWEATLSKNVGA